MVGTTGSTSGIAKNGFQNTLGGYVDCFVVKLNQTGLIDWSTYFGGKNGEGGSGICVDKNKNIYVLGNSDSTSVIPHGGFQDSYGGGINDAFLIKFTEQGSIEWATYYGGEGYDLGFGVSVDSIGNVFIVGSTVSLNNIASGGIQNSFGGGGDDAFIAKFNKIGLRIWGTYYGGSQNDGAKGITINIDDNIYVAGYTLSDSKIAFGGFQNTIGGAYDAFILKLTDRMTSNRITGTIFNDNNNNCLKDGNEKAFPNIVVKAEPVGFFSVSDSLGNYSISVDTGAYTIRQAIPTKLVKTINQTCPFTPPFYTVRFIDYGNKVVDKNFAEQAIFCPFLQTNVSSNHRRLCFLNSTVVSYSNSGFAEAENVKVYVKMPQYVVLKSADKPFTIDKDSNYVFNIGILDVNKSGTINIKDSVICKAGIIGLTACTKAWITPVNNCQPPKSSWDKSDIVLSGKCIENGRYRVYIKNIGEGDMADSSQFRVFLDAKLALKNGFKLAKGDSLRLTIPANGRTLRLEADERPDHPRKSMTSLTFEGCKANVNDVASTGFVNQFPQDDPEPEVSIDCKLIRDSYDPNEKEVSPIGTTSERFTPTNAELKYMISFQNTGTDTAYTVIITDTLDKNLDISTLEIGAASHKYNFTVSGKGQPVLIWTFNNIKLPDSTKNKIASNGFLSYSIKALPGLPLKTQIKNFADIVFDYNDPVRTKTTTNTLYDVPLIVDPTVRLNTNEVILATEEEKELQSIEVYPNPSEGTFTIDFSKGNQILKSVEVLNAQGQSIYLDKSFSNSKNNEINLAGKAPGLYFVQIHTDKGVKIKKIVLAK